MILGKKGIECYMSVISMVISSSEVIAMTMKHNCVKFFIIKLHGRKKGKKHDNENKTNE